MASFIESPFLQARQMLSLSPTSSNTLSETRAPTTNISSNMEQLMMPSHQMPQNQKQVILPETSKLNLLRKT